jgi:hypothetical protein
MYGHEKAIGHMTVQSITRTMAGMVRSYFFASSFFSSSSARFFSVSSSFAFGMKST